jgi:nitroreductase
MEPAMLEKPALTGTPIHDILARRWSTRAFDAARQVSREQLAALLEAARWAPSCNNVQPWRFLVWYKSADPAAWAKAFDCLSPGNKGWAGNAPVLMLSCAADNFPDGRPNRHAGHDAGMALLSVMLQAVAMGLAGHAMAGFNAEQARAGFAIPEGFTPMTMLAVGYQTGSDILAGSAKEKELAPRVRRPLGESFYAGHWGTPHAL